MKEKESLRYQIIISAIIVLVFAALVLGFYLNRRKFGVEQPIPFSHRVHVNDKKISCFFCHPEAMSTAQGGVPPLQTCMLCHDRIAITYPQIQKLREHYFANIPVLWARVYVLPEFTYFDHSMHIHRRMGCGECHGNVPLMDRIVLQQKLEMGFCVTCHKEKNISHDCLICHR